MNSLGSLMKKNPAMKQVIEASLTSQYLDRVSERVNLKPLMVGPKGFPIAELRFKDELPKIIERFGIKAPADLRLWRKAKHDFGIIESKVAYIEETMEADRKKGIFKQPPQYAGLLLWMIFPKKKE